MEAKESIKQEYHKALSTKKYLFTEYFEYYLCSKSIYTKAKKQLLKDFKEFYSLESFSDLHEEVLLLKHKLVDNIKEFDMLKWESKIFRIFNNENIMISNPKFVATLKNLE